MAMGPLITAAAALAGLNVLLLLPLLGVWVRNYATFRTGLVAGLIAFAVAMLAENAIAVYFFFSMQSFYAGDPHVQQAVLVLRSLQFIAIVGLSYTTLR
ncbi:hypothetical protein [Haloarcula sp. Atlit-120R]|uniref:hypothetical protein n=1 Tax=Haloarcula sp. Atlit-120R TaxID=2282135 RepID=UPI000EF20992|nr:hypothetical protein [Haloarcula sp. Atlit-120R]RLM36834.1 hypothetical protein DVK01_09455 [Haloarcula sp. Atlit-120R]